MTKFQQTQVIKLIEGMGIKKGSSKLQDYEAAKRILFPYGRLDPIPDLEYGQTIHWLAEYLSV